MGVLEVCVGDIQGLRAAEAGGADRIELCGALALGGLTPPESLVRAAAGVPVPVHMLARPREGDFIYSSGDVALVARDIALAAEAGFAGVVIGANCADRSLAREVLWGWIGHARSCGAARGRPLSLTLHRAFDLCPSQQEALEDAVELGFDTVLTSGGVPRAADALGQLALLCRQAAGRIAIMAGGGVDPGNVRSVLATGVAAVHASCRIAGGSWGAREEALGFAAGDRRITTPEAVFALKRMVQDHIKGNL